MNPSFSPNNIFLPNYSFLHQSSNEIGQQEQKVDGWTWPEDKIFEITLAEFGVESENLLPILTSILPKKTISQIRNHYAALVEDLRMIEDDLVEIPNYRVNNRQRKKLMRWTTAENELFIEGLEKYGKGDWKSISKYLVKTKTPAQIASHAQKYFIKQNRATAVQKDDSSSNEDHTPTTSSNVYYF